jgi:probable HAF family extracellular repeat protein
MWRRARSSAVFISVVVLVLWGSAPDVGTQSGTPSYGLTDLGTIGGTTSIARGLSGGGFPMIAGYGTTASGQEHAFVGNPFRLTDIGTLGGARSEARATEVGQVVGLAQLPNGAYRAFLHSIGRPGLVDLGTLGGSESYATAINVHAVVVGASRTAGDSSTRGFVYQNGAMTALGATLGGPNTVATGINEQGHIVGYADRSGGQSHHAFLYANGVTTDLGSLGGASEAYAINDSGVIVGRSHLVTGTNHHAFRYQNGVLQDLGTLGGASSEAADVSNDGVVVGWADTAQGERRAFIWRNGVMTDLNTLIPSGTGWVLQAATGIGNGTAARPGAIVGYGVFQGRLRAFMLTPPTDLRADLRVHTDQLDTNIPNPHETGQQLHWGVTVYQTTPGYQATGVTVTHTIGGPVEYLGWVAPTAMPGCVQDGQRITCRIGTVEFERTVHIRVRSTGPGTITHAATVSSDQPDPNPSNNSATESNTAVSLASLTLTPTTVIGGQLSLARATLTSPTPSGGARVRLTSSHPDIASVPSEFDVLPWSGDGLWREFYVTTKAVSAPVTVQIGATYGLVTRTVALTIMPAASQSPFGGTARAIPGTIQAEDFDEGGEGVAYHDSSPGNEGGAYRSTNVDIQSTSDTGGGSNVGWIQAGEWLEYTVNVAAAGTYTLEARVASPGAGGTFHVEMDGVNKTGTMSVPDTAGWQSWRIISRSVTLEAGTHILRVSFDSNGVTGAFGNLNYLRFVSATVGPPPIPPRPVPGTVQAEDFDEGGEGVGYHDSTAENSGGQYRATGVDIERTTDTGGGFNVGWMTAGEWLKYTVSVSQAGTYTLTARVAANGVGGTFHVEFGGVDDVPRPAVITGPLTIPNTGGWQAWTDVTATVTLGAGTKTIRFVADRNGPTGVFGNLNYLKLALATTAPSDIVLYATDLMLHGAWSRVSDSSAAGGQKALTPDVGWSTTSAPLANPVDYFEATFDAPAATPYTLWLRLRATGDTKASESVWVQYSDARANGSSVFPIGSTSGLLVNLEPCSNCGVSGWGWKNGAYWLSQASTVSFTATGRHTIRIQVREDGTQIDQIVLSPSRYLNTPPGPVRNDNTIVPK